MDLARLVKERKISSSSDFEWLKQVSFICERKYRVVMESKQTMISRAWASISNVQGSLDLSMKHGYQQKTVEN